MRLALSLVIIVVGLEWTAVSSARAGTLPRFTEEREAAALHFVKKNLPDLLPLLADLKKTDAMRYQREVSEIFHVSEMLADLQDEPKRHNVELKMWKAENRIHILIAKLVAPPEETPEEKKRLHEKLRDLARELVELEMQVLEVQAEQLEKELGEIKDELARSREKVEENVKARFDLLIEKTRKPRK